MQATSAPILITGFLTAAQDAVNKAIQHLTSAQIIYQNKTNVLPEDAQNSGFSLADNTVANDITPSFEIINGTAENQAGQLKVKVTLTKDGKSATSEPLTITEFLTTDQKAVNDAKAAITIVDYTDKASVLPLAADSTKFNVTQDPTQNPAAGITVSYEIVENSQNNDAGTLKVKVILTKNEKQAVTKEFEVSGFLTNDQKLVNEELAKISSANIDYPEKSNALPTDAVENNFRLSVQLADGVTPSYEIVSNSQQDALGTLKVKVILTKNEKQAVTEEFEVSGFLTSDQKLVNEELAKISSASIDYPEKSNTLPNDADENNFTLSAVQLADGVTPSYEIVDSSRKDGEGTLQVKVTLTKNGKTAVSDVLLITGFLTTDKKAVNDAKTAITSVDYTGKESVLPSEVTDSNLTFTVTQAPTDHEIDVSYRIVPSSQNDAEGTLKVQVTLTKNNESAVTGEFDVSGFLTSDKKLLNDELAKITSVDYRDKENVLPSNADVNNFTIQPTLTTDVTPTYEIVDGSKDDENGSLQVKVVLSKNNNSVTSQPFTVNGFKTSEPSEESIEVTPA
ncbi:Lipoprotein associated domain [Mycoplasmopsis columbinasalis]|uniref:Lipoprotein associated domain n=1 Tax=Mycoplasmopsis columbinasalis TaxID=114880 RepID=A0A449B9I4_9BACT|nr:Lipoprotein associated domain [Mycoplasmopsis columbinasalis]